MSAIRERDFTIPTQDEKSMAHKASQSIITHIRKIRDDEVLRLRFEDEQDPIEMPTLALHLLNKVLLEIAKGNAVTIIPMHAELTTQDAATLLNVSRPHLIKLLNKGELKFHLAGTHRRINASDLKAYMDRRDGEREEGMAALARFAQEDGLGY